MQPLALHRAIVCGLYLLSTASSIVVMRLPETQTSLVTLLSSGAILATFGSAIATLGGVWERDLVGRICMNVDIFYKDIFKQEPWRRWPFVPRSDEQHLLNGNILLKTLKNPEIPFDVGTHTIKVSLPTVLEDFFDLPLRKNFLALARFRSAAVTTLDRKKSAQTKLGENLPKGLSAFDEYIAYECLHDTWRSILVFRVARYATHLGASLTVSSVVATAIYSASRAA